MSRASKLTLLGTSLFALSTVVFVHYQQKAEQEVCVCQSPALTLHTPNLRKVDLLQKVLTSPAPGAIQAMHQGVIRDLEQQRLKRERQADFELQQALEAEYKKEQTVRDSTGEMDSPGRGPAQGLGR